jgi:hypothetical protein
MAEDVKKCPIELKPMKDWVQETDPEKCRSCMLGPVVQWYEETLREQGEVSLAIELVDNALNNKEATPLTICEQLDKIKAAVGESLRERLKDFDCSAQTFEPKD